MADSTYDVSFFSPKTPATKDNMKMVVIMLIVWAAAVFGFQFLLIAMNKPTPEASLSNFTKVWPGIQTGTASEQDQKDLAKVVLMVLGKNIAVKEPHKKVLRNVLTATTFALGAQGTDPKAAASAIGLGSEGFDPLLASILKMSLVPVTSATISDADKAALPQIMDLYLIHNRSALTDTRFLGFPFHYWYTSQFLLILFVALCWIFCFKTDAANVKYHLETEDAEQTETAPVAEAPKAAETSEEKKEN